MQQLNTSSQLCLQSMVVREHSTGYKMILVPCIKCINQTLIRCNICLHSY